MRAYRNLGGTVFLSMSIFFALSIAFSPTSTQAATNVSLRELLPPAGNNAACAPIQVSDVHPNIYGGKMDSFDFLISAPSYVALGGSVGETPVDFHYMTRWQDLNGNLRIHVDLPSTSLSRDLPIQVVLISAAGQVICSATVSTVIPKLIYIPHYPTTPKVPTSSHPAPVSQGNPSGTHPVPPPATSGSEQGSETSAGLTTSSVMFVGALHSLGSLCQVGGSSRLWIVLVVLYALFVLTLLLQKADSFGERTMEWNIALVLVLFVGLLAFWYLSLTCRTGIWAPVLSTLIALFGLICLLILGGPSERPLLLLEDREE